MAGFRSLRQVELAVFLVLQSVERVLPALGVPVTALNSGVFQDCWRGRPPLVRHRRRDVSLQPNGSVRGLTGWACWI